MESTELEALKTSWNQYLSATQKAEEAIWEAFTDTVTQLDTDEQEVVRKRLLELFNRL